VTSNLASRHKKAEHVQCGIYRGKDNKSFVVYILTSKFFEIRILPGISRQLADWQDSGLLTKTKLAHKRRLDRPSKYFSEDFPRPISTAS
jgi:hypothetical protein